jgi:hypothetical protein
VELERIEWERSKENDEDGIWFLLLLIGGNQFSNWIPASHHNINMSNIKREGSKRGGIN